MPVAPSLGGDSLFGLSTVVCGFFWCRIGLGRQKTVRVRTICRPDLCSHWYVSEQCKVWQVVRLSLNHMNVGSHDGHHTPKIFQYNRKDTKSLLAPSPSPSMVFVGNSFFKIVIQRSSYTCWNQSDIIDRNGATLRSL